MTTELLVETRQLLAELLEKCEGEFHTAVDLDTLQLNDLGQRAVGLVDRIDQALAIQPPGIAQRFFAAVRGGF